MEIHSAKRSERGRSSTTNDNDEKRSSKMATAGPSGGASGGGEREKDQDRRKEEQAAVFAKKKADAEQELDGKIAREEQLFRQSVQDHAAAVRLDRDPHRHYAVVSQQQIRVNTLLNTILVEYGSMSSAAYQRGFQLRSEIERWLCRHS